MEILLSILDVMRSLDARLSALEAQGGEGGGGGERSEPVGREEGAARVRAAQERQSREAPTLADDPFHDTETGEPIDPARDKREQTRRRRALWPRG
jgi:hypothetical protein